MGNVHNQMAKIMYDLIEHSSIHCDPRSQEFEAGRLCAPGVLNEEMSQTVTSLPYNLVNKSRN